MTDGCRDGEGMERGWKGMAEGWKGMERGLRTDEDGGRGGGERVERVGGEEVWRKTNELQVPQEKLSTQFNRANHQLVAASFSAARWNFLRSYKFCHFTCQKC